MNKIGFNIRVMNEKFGELVNETFMDQVQFKLFLKMVHACIELNNDLTFFNGDTFFVNIPAKTLKDSIVVTTTKELTISEQVKSKIEALVTK
ncbi:MAG: hypothetical protein ACXACC_10760 [Promethearchaeota archaeon]|jgi:hypothetical protein